MNRVAVVLLLPVTLIITGCASTVAPTPYLVHHNVPYTDIPQEEGISVLWTDLTVSMAPYKNIAVGTFAVEKAVGATPQINKEAFAQSFREKLIASFRRNGRNAVTDEKALASKGPYLLVQGNIAQLNPGKLQLRRWIGFGAGRAIVDVEVKVFRVTGVSRVLCGELTVTQMKSMALGGGTDAGFLNHCLDRIAERTAKYVTTHRNR